MLACGWVDLCGNARPEDCARGGCRYLSVARLRSFSFGKGAASPLSLVSRRMSACESASQRSHTSVGHQESVPSVTTFEFSSRA